MEASSWIGIGTLVVAVVGLGFISRQLQEQRRAQRAEFGNLYIQRYWAIDDDLLMEAKVSPRHKQHRHRYLRLFEDEFDVARLGFLDLRQWGAWHALLDDPGMTSRVTGDLDACDPTADQFLRIRACIDQRNRDQGPHTWQSCNGAA